MRRPWTLWPLLLPGWEKKAKARETYNLDRNSVVRDAKTGELSVKYHPSVAGGTPITSSRTEVGPGDTGPDQFWKLFSFLTVIAFPLLFALHQTYPDTDWLFFGAVDRPLVLMIAALVLLFSNAWVVGRLFNAMDRKWQIANPKLFDPDAKSRMTGIRDTMSTFRGFVKWRRYMSYLLLPAWGLALAEIGWHLFSFSPWADPDGSRVFLSDLYNSIALVCEFASVAIFSFLKWYYTDTRDPTLHLNVMVAEDFRYIDATRRNRP